MNDEHDNFEQLWQQQSVSKVDVGALKKQWRKMRFKQFFYVLLDALAVISLPIILLFVEKKMTKAEFVSFTVLFILLSVWFFYLVWLRRYSLRSSNDAASTADFVERMKLQYRQNIRIAYVNKVLCFYTPLIFIGFLFALYFGDGMSTDELWRKSKVMLGVSVLFLPASWVWADRRQKKFEKLLADFEAKWANGLV